jgi:hypothetical protein
MYQDVFNDRNIFHQMEESVTSSSVISVNDDTTRLYASCLRNALGKMDLDESGRELMSQLTAAVDGDFDEVDAKLLKKYFGS